MFVDYARHLLEAEDRLTETEKVKMATSIEKWANTHYTGDVVEIHRTLDDWIDEKIKRRRTLSLNYPISEKTEFGDLIKDPDAQSPADIVMVDRDFSIMGPQELIDSAGEYLDDDSKEIVSEMIRQNPDNDYKVKADERTVKERLAVVKPRIREGKLLVPKKVISLRFSRKGLEINYRRGFSDEYINRALILYSQGYSTIKIGDILGIHNSTASKWLYKKMGLPHLPTKTVESMRRMKEILRLYDDNMRPKEIAECLGCSDNTVYEVLKKYRGLEFNWGGPDPWVYELTGEVKTLWDFRKIDFFGTRRSQYYYEERHEQIFRYIRELEKELGRGATHDELYEDLGFRPWRYLQEMTEIGVLKKYRIPKEYMFTPGLLIKKPLS